MPNIEIKALFVFAFAASLALSHAALAAEREPDFDKPLAKAEHPIPPSKEVLDSRAHVTCYEYPTFAVKEVDLAEVGAERLALLPPLKKGEKRKCERDDHTGERELKLDDFYFWGAKGPYVFFRGADTMSGLAWLEVFEAKSGASILRVSYDGELAFKGHPPKLGLTFRAEIGADCSYPKEGAKCWEKMLKASGVPASLYPKQPECPLAINDADGDKLPAAVSAPASVEDLSKPKLTFVKGTLKCWTKE